MLRLIRYQEDGLYIGDTKLSSTHQMRVYIQSIIQTSDLHTELKGVRTSTSDLTTTIGGHDPVDLFVNFGIGFYRNLTTYLGANQPIPLTVKLRVLFTSLVDLEVDLDVISISDLIVQMATFHTSDFTTSLTSIPPKDLNVQFRVWATSLLYAIVGAHPPGDFTVAIEGLPMGGKDLIATFSVTERKDLPVTLTPFGYVHDFLASLLPQRLADLTVSANPSGGYKDLVVYTPLQSAWENLYVALTVNVRRISSFIPIHMMEHKDLYVSINQWLPCGFGSAYKDLIVYATPKPDYLLNVYLHAIKGSGTKDLVIYINNRFDYYFDVKPIQFTVIETGIVLDFKTVVLDTTFSDIYLDHRVLEFDMPRRHLLGGDLALYVYLEPILARTKDLTITLKPRKQLPPVLQGTGEIELWDFDTPEIVRIVEILFEQQVYEYVWCSHEQRAYSRELWEKWCLMSRSYLPKEEYGGQIDYTSIERLCYVPQFNTIDAAVRWLIDHSYTSEAKNLSITLNARRTIADLQVFLNALEKISVLRISLVPVGYGDLVVTLTPI
jgi:hypothetical protein